jgi:hypothetical protein
VQPIGRTGRLGLDLMVDTVSKSEKQHVVGRRGFGGLRGYGRKVTETKKNYFSHECATIASRDKIRLWSHASHRMSVVRCHLPMHLRVTLPCQLHHIVGHTRRASTSPSSTPTQFPFPAHRNPTPHQIFHLPLNASHAEIKARCTSIFHLRVLHVATHRASRRL